MQATGPLYLSLHLKRPYLFLILHSCGLKKLARKLCVTVNFQKGGA